MALGKKIAELLASLEHELLDPAVRADANRLDQLLDPEFIEFGASGHVYDKPTMLSELAANPRFNYSITVEDLQVRELSPTVAQITYRVRESGTRRSSIWRLSGDQWRMVFHQGTRTG